MIMNSPQRVSSMQPPSIQSVGQPPEAHAHRVVSEMLRWIVATRRERQRRIQQVLDRTPDGNPRAQRKMAKKIESLGKPFAIGSRSSRANEAVMNL
jgi:hypothetical protein